MAPMDAIWLLLVKTYPLPTTSWIPAHPPPSHPIGVPLVLAMPLKHYLKWWERQLAIHPILGGQIDYKYLQNCVKFHASSCFPSRVIILQIIKIVFLNIYNCGMEARFSQIQSHMCMSIIQSMMNLKGLTCTIIYALYYNSG